MHINRITGFMNNNTYKSNVNFNGHYRSLEVKTLDKDVFQARVAGSDENSGICNNRDEAIYFAIRNSNDYVPNNKIEKVENKDSNKDANVLEVYFTDRDESVNLKHVEPYADYIVYASGSVTKIYP